jgi:hypothetical protein
MATHPLRLHHGADTLTSAESATGRSELRWRYSASLGTVGGLLVLMALWAGIMPFVGSSFKFSPDGLGLYHWDLARGLLAVLPAGAGLLVGLALMQFGRVASLGFGRLGITVAGLLAIAAGCWFAIGPVAWPVLEGHQYLVSSGAYSAFERELAYSLGPGLFFVILGGVACEFAALQTADARRVAVAVTAAPSAVPVDASSRVVGEGAPASTYTDPVIAVPDTAEVPNEVD